MIYYDDLSETIKFEFDGSTVESRTKPNSLFLSNICSGGESEAITTWEYFIDHTSNSFSFKIKYDCNKALW